MASATVPQLILVPVSGTDLDEEIVRLAVMLAEPRHSELILVYVIVVPRGLPLDAPIEDEEVEGQEILGRAERIADEGGVDYTSEVLQARMVGPAIVDESIDRQADLIVMGVRHREQYGAYSLGKTVPYVLAHAPCRVWVIREARAEEEPV